MVVGESPGEVPRERVGEASLGEEEMSEEGRKVAEEDRKVAEGDHKVEVRPPEEEGMITQEGIQVDNGVSKVVHLSPICLEVSVGNILYESSLYKTLEFIVFFKIWSKSTKSFEHAASNNMGLTVASL